MTAASGWLGYSFLAFFASGVAIAIALGMIAVALLAEVVLPRPGR